jgi:ferredoxin-NADP reductase
VPDWKTRHFFVSGPPGMTGAIAQMLLNDVGVPSDHVIAEYFTGYE